MGAIYYVHTGTVFLTVMLLFYVLTKRGLEKLENNSVNLELAVEWSSPMQ